ncbi:unnamed protein product [Ectocarpus fasciculatus]
MVRNISSQADFDSSIKAPNLVVVDFYGDWCGPCRRIAPAVEQMSFKYPDVTFVKVNDKDCPDLVMSSGIRAFPTFQFFVNGRKVDEMKGADEAQLERKVVQWQAEAGGSSFAGAGNTLGGWDGVGAPPGAGGAATAREARLKALEQRGAATGPATAAPAPARATVTAPAPFSEDDAALAKALKLSLAAEQEAADTAEAEAQQAEEERTDATVSSAMDVEGGDGEEMVPVPVDNAVLAQLIEFGFSDIRARKGLVHGKNSLDAALAWLGEHENDTDIDQPYMVRKADADKETAPKIPLTPEEKARRVAELKNKIDAKRKERERDEKAAALKAEKDRRLHGQELESIQEERDRLMRKRELERKRKEKEDEKKERERLRAEIARDKEMRRANKGVLPSVLGVDGYNPSIGAKADPNAAPSDSTAASALQKVDAALGTVSRYRTGGDGGQVLKMLSLYVQNIAQKPTEAKYQTINMESKAFKSKVAPFVGPMQLFKALGFVKLDDEQKLTLPK